MKQLAFVLFVLGETVAVAAGPNLLLDPEFEMYTGEDMYFNIIRTGYSYTHWVKPAAATTHPTNNGTNSRAPFDPGTHGPGSNSVHFLNSYGVGDYSYGVETAAPVAYPPNTGFAAAIWFTGGAFYDVPSTPINLHPTDLSVTIQVQPVDSLSNPVGPVLGGTVTYNVTAFETWYQCIVTGTTPATSTGVIVRYIVNVPPLSAGNGAATGMDHAYFGASPPITISAVNVTPASRILSGPPYNAGFDVDYSGGVGPYTIQWNYGDSQTGLGETVSHTYTAEGNYTATVTVSDSENVASATAFVVAVAGGVPQQTWHRLAVDYDWEGGQHPDGAYPLHPYAVGKVGVPESDFHYINYSGRLTGSGGYRDAENVHIYEGSEGGYYLNLQDSPSDRDWFDYSFDIPAQGAWRVDFRLASNQPASFIDAQWDGVLISRVRMTAGAGMLTFVSYSTPAFEVLPGTHTLRVLSGGYTPNFARMEIQYYSVYELPALRPPDYFEYSGVEHWALFE